MRATRSLPVIIALTGALAAALALFACGDDSSSSGQGHGGSGAGGSASTGDGGGDSDDDDDDDGSSSDGTGGDANPSSSSNSSSQAASSSGSGASTSATTGGEATFTAIIQTPEARIVTSAEAYYGTPVGMIFVVLHLEGGVGPSEDGVRIRFHPEDAPADNTELACENGSGANRVTYVGDDPQGIWGCQPGVPLLVRHHGAIGDVVDFHYEGSLQIGSSDGTRYLNDVVIDVQVPRGPDHDDEFS